MANRQVRSGGVAPASRAPEPLRAAGERSEPPAADFDFGRLPLQPSRSARPMTVGRADDSLERDADRAADTVMRMPAGASPPVVQRTGDSGTIRRAVRVDDGAKKVNEAAYAKGGPKEKVGSRVKVSSLIGDATKRVFADTAELEEFANGKADYIGDVATKSAGTFWYRLPKSSLTVLGEFHDKPTGNALDIITGLRTARFMYEGLNEMESVPALDIPYSKTDARLTQVNSGIPASKQADPSKFNPNLENIVVKAMTGAGMVRNEFIPGDPPNMDAAAKKKWGKRPTASDYSLGERAALYFTMGIHIAQDVAQHDFGRENSVESPYVVSARALKVFYLAHQAELDALASAKDGDDLSGIYELTSADGFKTLPTLKDFSLLMHEYGSLYIERLGVKTGNTALESAGTALRSNTGAKLDDFSPAREEIMWSKIQAAQAKNYLVIGMGDAHRQSLEPRLKKAGIAEEEAETSLKRQKADVDAKWKA